MEVLDGLNFKGLISEEIVNNYIYSDSDFKHTFKKFILEGVLESNIPFENTYDALDEVYGNISNKSVIQVFEFFIPPNHEELLFNSSNEIKNLIRSCHRHKLKVYAKLPEYTRMAIQFAAILLDKYLLMSIVEK